MQMEIPKFYDEVIKEFIEKLNKRYQTRDGLDSNKIDLLHQKLKKKLQATSELFKRVTQDFYSQGISNVQQKQNQQKQPVVEIQVKNQVIDDDNDSQMSDDLQKFEVKQEYVAEDQQEEQENNINQIKEEQNKLNDDSADEIQKQKALQIAKQRIQIHVIGTYLTKQKKHIAKDEKTKLDLQNVFIKTQSMPGKNMINEIYFSKVSFDLSKTQGADIKN